MIAVAGRWLFRTASSTRPKIPVHDDAMQLCHAIDNSPWMAVWPGLAIVVLVLSFNLFGDGLRDALDPKHK